MSKPRIRILFRLDGYLAEVVDMPKSAWNNKYWAEYLKRVTDKGRVILRHVNMNNCRFPKHSHS